MRRNKVCLSRRSILVALEMSLRTSLQVQKKMMMRTRRRRMKVNSNRLVIILKTIIHPKFNPKARKTLNNNNRNKIMKKNKVTKKNKIRNKIPKTKSNHKNCRKRRRLIRTRCLRLINPPMPKMLKRYQ